MSATISCAKEIFANLFHVMRNPWSTMVGSGKMGQSDGVTFWLTVPCDHLYSVQLLHIKRVHTNGSILPSDRWKLHMTSHINIYIYIYFVFSTPLEDWSSKVDKDWWEIKTLVLTSLEAFSVPSLNENLHYILFWVFSTHSI